MMANPWLIISANAEHDPRLLNLSTSAKNLAGIAHEIAWEQKTCYPNWLSVQKESGFNNDDFMEAFEDLCKAGIVFSGFPSLLVAFADIFPLAPMFGPIGSSRPSASVWYAIRARIFDRDDYTCAYCGLRGGQLECDHVIPVSRGGSHTDDNLVTACKKCNRSKRDKLVEEWRPN